MTDQDLLAKLEQIEEHARLTLADYPSRDLVRERQRMIIALTRFIRSNMSMRALGASAEQTVPPAGGERPSH
jgi:hypothetical protein